MRITDLLDARSISLQAAPGNKEEALNQAVELMTQRGNISDKAAYRRQVGEREKESTTGIGEGIAIPHGKCAAVSAPGLAAMVIPGGVDFDSLDGEPVTLLFLIAAPDTEDNIHLDVLGKLSMLLMDEELEKLNKGFDELIKWDKMVAKSQKQNAENKQKFQNTKLDESFDAFDINQACDYIQDSYLEFRSLYLEQYERTGGNIDIKSLFSYVLRSGNQDMHKYCEFLFEKIGFIV